MNVRQKLLANKLAFGGPNEVDRFVCSCRRRNSGLAVEKR
jgi:hypothetical protein